MNSFAQALLSEFEHEAATTRRCLERIPEDRLSWRPHPRSMSAGQLGLHIAQAPGMLVKMAAGEDYPLPDFVQAEAGAVGDILATFDQSVATVKAELPKIEDARLGSAVRFTRNGQTVFEFPRGAMLRSLLLNHWYHHRGQLSVYLREMGAAVPSIYGPSADERMPGL